MSDKMVRSGAAILCAVVGGLYVAIGFGFIRVVEQPADKPLVLAVLGGIYLAMGAALWLTDRIGLLVGAAAFQLMVMAGYLAVASNREPAFEGWGIALKLAEVVICAALAYLVLHHARHADTAHFAHAAG
jgi:hypothetical protein